MRDGRLSDFHRQIFVAGVLALGAATSLAEESAQATFDSVYGEAYKKALASTDKEDDLALAVRLLAGIEAAGEKKDLVALLCEKAAETAGRHPGGSATAVDAWMKLAMAAPARRADCLEKIMAIREKTFLGATRAERLPAAEQWLWSVLEFAESRGASDPQAALAAVRKALPVATSGGSGLRGVLNARGKSLGDRCRVLGEMKALAGRLKTNENDDASRESLILLNLTELDDPNAANQLLKSGCSEQIRTYVPMAAKSLVELPEDACLELAKWYVRVSEGRSDAGRIACLRRAKGCLKAWMVKHPKEDENSTAVKLRLSDLDAQLVAMGGQPMSDGMLILEETFDTVGPAGVIPGWTASAPQGNAVALAHEADSRFLGIVCRTGHPTHAGRRLSLRPEWSTVSIFMRYRTSKVAADGDPYHRAGMYISVKDAEGREIRGHDERCYGDEDWHPYAATVDLPRGARWLDIDFGFHGWKGEMGVDELRMYANGAPVAMPFHEGFPEGMFEKLTPSGLPVGWGGNPRLVKVVREEGKAILRLANAGTSRNNIYARASVRVEPHWKGVRLTARVRTTGIVKNVDAPWLGAHINWGFQGVEAVQVGNVPAAWGTNDNKGWNNVALETKVPQGASRLNLSIGMDGIPGTLDVAAVKLEVAEEK